ncbi:MAG: alpha/beta hydrolase fold protein [Chitinophagaceae bacterium]|nr:alpha/beta hydrolase fold protein [Chitinophagaceae bacterium]
MLFTQTFGSGSTHILFIHGNSQSGKVWEPLIQSANLANKYTLVTVDLPGHGQSFKSATPEIDYSLQGMANLLGDFLETFSMKEYLIVCHSLATNLVAEIAISLKIAGVFF